MNQIVNQNEVKVTKWWTLNMASWSCVSIIWIKGNVWVMWHLFASNKIEDMTQKMKEALKKYWIKLDDCKIFACWWTCSKRFNNLTYKKPWEQNIEAVTKVFWNRVKKLCIWWEDYRNIELNTANSEIIVEKYKWSGKYIEGRFKIQ